MKLNRHLRYLWAIFLPLALVGCGSNTTLQDPLTNEPKATKPVLQATRYSGPVHKLTKLSDIKKLQRLLDTHGYKLGEIDGHVGPKTKSAIQSFQRDHQLRIDRIASFEMLRYLSELYEPNPMRPLPSNPPRPIPYIESGKTIANRCVQTGDQSLDTIKTLLFDEIIDHLQIDIGPYLQGFCGPKDLETLRRLYAYLVTEGVIHGRIASTKYYRLITVYEKAGVALSVKTNSLRLSTESFPKDLVNYAEQKDIYEAPGLIENRFKAEDDEEFQKAIISAFQHIDDDSRYKEDAAKLLTDVLSHSTLSTFYLVRSALVISDLTNHFGIDIKSNSNFFEGLFPLLKDFIKQFGENAELALFLYNSQDDLNSMLISSTYGIRALDQRIEEIPPIDTEKATKEAQELKIQAGVSADELDNKLVEENRYRSDQTPG